MGAANAQCDVVTQNSKLLSCPKFINCWLLQVFIRMRCMQTVRCDLLAKRRHQLLSNTCSVDLSVEHQKDMSPVNFLVQYAERKRFQVDFKVPRDAGDVEAMSQDPWLQFHQAISARWITTHTRESYRVCERHGQLQISQCLKRKVRSND